MPSIRPATVLSPSTRADTVQAVVQTGATETRYYRAGTGRPVLLLNAHGTADPLGAFLFHVLTSCSRVIAPEPATGTVMPRSSWIRDVMDGLGLMRPSIVADGVLGISALNFALTDPERVDRLIVVSRDLADPAAPTGAVDDALQCGIPLLLLRAEAGDAAAPLTVGQVDQLLDFFRGH